MAHFFKGKNKKKSWQKENIVPKYNFYWNRKFRRALKYFLVIYL